MKTAQLQTAEGGFLLYLTDNTPSHPMMVDMRIRNRTIVTTTLEAAIIEINEFLKVEVPLTSGITISNLKG